MIPSEILSEIFFHCMTIYPPAELDLPVTAKDNSPVKDISFDSAPLLLFRVCHTWREVAKGSPRLFTQIILSGRSSVNPLLILSMWLSCSGSLPLDVCLRPDKWLGVQTDAVRNSFRLLRGHIKRIRTLKVPTHHTLDALIPRHDIIVAPALRELQLIGKYDTANHLDVGGLLAKNIEVFKTSSVYQWTGFVQLGQSLTDFRDTMGSYSPKNLIGFFKRYQNLQRCSLTYDEFFEDMPGFSRQLHVHLPNLKQLTLSWYGSMRHISTFMSILVLPALEILTLDNGSTTLQNALLSDLKTSLMRSRSPMLSLVLIGISTPAETLLPLLTELPMLQSLSILRGAFSDDAMDILNRNLYPDLLLNLKRIAFCRVDLPGEGLVNMITSRVHAGPREEVLGESLVALSVSYCHKLESKIGSDLDALAKHYSHLTVRLKNNAYRSV